MSKPSYPATTPSYESYSPGNDWAIYWYDEFDGNSIDESKWNFQEEPAVRINKEWQRYVHSSHNAYIENGCLVLKAIHYGKKHCLNAYTSARLNTAGKFSWNQSRFNLTGWFGMGEALAQLKKENHKAFSEMKQRAKTWPFLKYQLIQIESNLLDAETSIMKQFAELVEYTTTRQEISDLILGDYEKCLTLIGELLQDPLEERRVSKLSNIKIRRNALQALHNIQITYLKSGVNRIATNLKNTKKPYCSCCL